MRDFIFVSYYWGDEKYKRFAQRFVQSCKHHKVPVFVKHMPQFDAVYQKGINYKPQFIMSMIKKYRKTYKAVIYMDIDMILKKYPKLFHSNSDFMCFNWNYDPRIIANGCIDMYTLETAGGLMYFACNDVALQLLAMWKRALHSKAHMLQADDRVLAMVFASHNMTNSMRVQWLPVEYFYIPQYMSHAKVQPVIVHDQDITPEELATQRGASANRIPQNYKVQYSVRNKTNRMLMSSNNSHNKPLEKSLQKHGFRFESMYRLPNVGNTTCTTTGNLCFDPSTANATEILEVWKKHIHNCDIYIAKEHFKVNVDADIASNKFDITKRKLFYSKNIKLYLKRNETNYAMVYNWSKYNDTSVNGLVEVFNKNAGYLLQNRVHKI